MRPEEPICYLDLCFALQQHPDWEKGYKEALNKKKKKRRRERSKKKMEKEKEKRVQRTIRSMRPEEPISYSDLCFALQQQFQKKIVLIFF